MLVERFCHEAREGFSLVLWRVNSIKDLAEGREYTCKRARDQFITKNRRKRRTEPAAWLWDQGIVFEVGIDQISQAQLFSKLKRNKIYFTEFQFIDVRFDKNMLFSSWERVVAHQVCFNMPFVSQWSTGICFVLSSNCNWLKTRLAKL